MITIRNSKTGEIRQLNKVLGDHPNLIQAEVLASYFDEHGEQFLPNGDGFISLNDPADARCTTQWVVE